MFTIGQKRRRRSEVRLGATPSAPRTEAVSLTPLLALWRERRVRLSSGLLLLCLAWGLYVLFRTPAFFVYTAEIRGNTAISAREIYAASGVDSQSIFWLNPSEIGRRVAALPNIKTAAVSLALPARVTIEVVERRPEILWQTGETVWWVDEEGTVVPPKGDVSGMMRIIDDDQRALQAGYKIDPTIIRGVQTLRILVPNLSMARYSQEQGLIVATPEGWLVYLGDGHEIKAKLTVLTALLADLRERDVRPTYIDVQDPLRPVYRAVPIVRLAAPQGAATP
jgi:cell division protein FtsQ